MTGLTKAQALWTASNLVPGRRSKKKPLTDTDHSLPPTAGVKNEWIVTSMSLHGFTAQHGTIRLCVPCSVSSAVHAAHLVKGVGPGDSTTEL